MPHLGLFPQGLHSGVWAKKTNRFHRLSQPEQRSLSRGNSAPVEVTINSHHVVNIKTVLQNNIKLCNRKQCETKTNPHSFTFNAKARQSPPNKECSIDLSLVTAWLTTQPLKSSWIQTDEVSLAVKNPSILV